MWGYRKDMKFTFFFYDIIWKLAHPKIRINFLHKYTQLITLYRQQITLYR